MNGEKQIGGAMQEPYISCDNCGGEAYKIVLRQCGHIRIDGALRPQFEVHYGECVKCKKTVMIGDDELKPPVPAQNAPAPYQRQ